MTSHTCSPGHAGVLADGCARCDEHAENPLLTLDAPKTAELWDKMIAVEYGSDGAYETVNEKKAGRVLYHVALWLERRLGLRPWVPFSELGTYDGLTS